MVTIITDTTSELPDKLAEHHQIPVIPQLIHFGEQTYRENIDLSREEFINLLTSSPQLPKTAAPPPELFRSVFSELAGKNEGFLCLHPSSLLSGTVRSAVVAARDFPDQDIRVIDTRLIASPLAVVVHQAALMAEQGKSIDTIERASRELSQRGRLFFLVSTLEYLARGGRIGGASALIGNALQLKPILSLENGQVEPLCKERTWNKALKRLETLVIDAYPQDEEGFLTIMHADAPEKAEQLALNLHSALGTEPVLISDLTPAILTHAGPGAIAVGFFS